MVDKSEPAAHARSDFATVLTHEQAEIAKRRKLRGEGDDNRGLAGLALSGGGVRSAATCIGAMQALQVHGRMGHFDYLSSVSGGGYAGACFSAARSDKGGRFFPFGEGSQVGDAAAMGHLRNYSNYLMPRSRPAPRNLLDLAAVLLRGWACNALILVWVLLAAVLLTSYAYASSAELRHGGSLAASLAHHLYRPGDHVTFLRPFLATMMLGGVLATALIGWALLRSIRRRRDFVGDTSGRVLRTVTLLIALFALALLTDLQPYAILWFGRLGHLFEGKATLLAAASLVGTFASFAPTIGKFLTRTERSSEWGVLLRRGLAKLGVFAAACVVPLGLYLGYLATAFWLIPHAHDPAVWVLNWREVLLGIMAASMFITFWFGPNSYSLHRFYRDRLGKAFLVREHAATIEPVTGLGLSDLMASTGPFPVINAALNVQGSAKANQRGRNAEFFEMTPAFVGSELTEFVATRTMQQRDPALDLAAAVAISGAAVSSNMGSQTIRLMSFTLALLNLRLGYYLPNPNRRPDRGGKAKEWLGQLYEALLARMFLLLEMLNMLDENRKLVYLTDGGHIDNLGLYALLRRKCGLIMVIDAEEDQALSFGSLLKLERYARTDLGARIELPWQEIAQSARQVAEQLPTHAVQPRHGPHCAFGRIVYADGTKGMLVYVKSSLSGDEKDYLLDYALRNPAFPHESTGDQFFDEEQFEAYRALGFHMLDRVFGQGEAIAIKTDGHYGFASADAAWNELNGLLPAGPTGEDGT